MAKDKVSNIAWIRLGLAVVVIGTGITTAFVLAQADIKTVKAETVELKEDGCKPSGQNKIDILLIQKDLEIIQKTQEDGFKAVLEAVNNR
jgi:anionic cell wall polymer biosynthesis LytR-Cps2A-Psr (LCP) family protein